MNIFEEKRRRETEGPEARARRDREARAKRRGKHFLSDAFKVEGEQEWFRGQGRTFRKPAFSRYSPQPVAVPRNT